MKPTSSLDMKSTETTSTLWQILRARDATIRKLQLSGPSGNPLPEAAEPAPPAEPPPGEPGSQPDFHAQDIELAVLRSVIPLLTERTFLDIGAERGELSKVFIAAGLTGHLFEPAPEHAARLQALVAETKSIYHPWAIDSQDREAQLQLATDKSGTALPEFNSLNKLAESDPRIRQSPGPVVQCRSLRSLVTAGVIPPVIGLIKTDTEGNDAAVLRGMAPPQCEVLCCEFFTEGLYAGWPESHPAVILALAEKLGFDRYLAIKHCENLTWVSSGPTSFAPQTWGNLIFMRPAIWTAGLPVWLDLIRKNEEYVSSTYNSQVTESAMLRRVCDERLVLVHRLSEEKQSVSDDLAAANTLITEKDSALLEAHKEAERLRAIAAQRGESLLLSTREADELRAAAVDLTTDLKTKETSVLAAHAEIATLAKSLNERQQGLVVSQQEGDRLRAEIQAQQAGLVAKEGMIQELSRICEERLQLINSLAFEKGRPLAAATRVLGFHGQSFLRRLGRKWDKQLTAWLLARHPCQLGVLAQYPPRTMQPERFPAARPPRAWPRICIITPSYNQGTFLERTMDSVLGQNYPALAYGVQDGGSTDQSAEIITRRIGQLTHAESCKDEGQADAIAKGFKKLYPGAGDIMGWLNSDDVLLPGALAYVGRYFAMHPEVDVIYGHRVIIDENDGEIGRWFMPQYHADTLPWFDLVPQETLFWRARCYNQVGGIDPSFHFAVDWDLLLRFAQAGFCIRRVPYFLGCFRVHTSQKTSAHIQTLGEREMQRLRLRTHQREVPHWEIHSHLDAEIGRSARLAWRHRLGVRS